ncbi:MAG: pirin family protein [Bdellovibrionota bacterium]
MSAIDFILLPKKKSLGSNFFVRRSLPDTRKQMVGPFIFWDHIGPYVIQDGYEIQVRAHPHIGLSTMTYLFSGQLVHRDSLGNVQVIKAGQINWMTAGRGISHSERTEPFEGMNTMEGIQMWVALPDEDEDCAPSFLHKGLKAIPTMDIDSITYSILLGSYQQTNGAVKGYSPMFCLSAKPTKGHRAQLWTNEEHESALYVFSGAVTIDGKVIEQGQMAVMKPGQSIEYSCLEDSNIMYFGGKPFPQKKQIWWNFVSSSTQKIERAKQRWANHEFESVVDEDERIPLPEK